MTTTQKLIMTSCFGLKFLKNKLRFLSQSPISINRAEILNIFITDRTNLKRNVIDLLELRNLISVSGTRYTLTEKGKNFLNLFIHITTMSSHREREISSSISTVEISSKN